MARNGSGTYILPPSNPVVSGTVIESDWANDTMSDLAAAITQSIAYDGQTVPIANLPMGGFHHTNVSDPVSRNQYATLGMVQDGRHQRVQITSGVDNLVGTLVGGATSYTAGALVSFFAPANNTGPMTLNYNGIGARSLISSSGLPLIAGNVKAGDFLMAIYDGVQFKLISAVAATVAVSVLQLATTGQQRPGGVAFPPLTIATGTSVNIPAGTAWIIPPNSDDPNDAIPVSWAAQTITLGFLATSFTTTIAVNNLGQIVQFAGRVVGANLRGNAVLGVVEHITGVANKVITKPIIFGDDGYRGTDVATLLGNSIINGCIVSPDLTLPLQLDIAAGAIFMPGGDANTINSPNQYPVAQQTNIQFRTLAGQNTLGGGVISNAPVASYDPNGLGVVTTIPNNNDCVIHRLYYLYGSFIWVYGQKIYNNVENALSMIEWDRTQYKQSLFLLDATLVAEIACIKNTSNLANIAQAAIVAPGAINFSIGSPGGITEAPIDGTPYGRQDAAWVQVLRRASPNATGILTITDPANPNIRQVLSPYGAGTIALRHMGSSLSNNWFSIETVNPDDKTYFRSYNATTGALRFTTTYNLATGSWDFPVKPTIGGVDSIVAGPAVSVDNDVARFSGTTGKLLKAGLQYQSNQFDTGAGKLLLTGAFGVGGSASLAAGTNLNGVVNSGFYRMLGTPVNGPTHPSANVSDSQLLVCRGLDTIAQMVFQYSSGRSWTRAGSPPEVGGVGAWSPWQLNIAGSEAYISPNLNNMTLSGFYAIANTAVNQPIAGAYGELIVVANDATQVSQYFSQAGAAGVNLYFRHNSGGWSSWVPLYTDSGATLIGVNGNYQTLDQTYVRRIGKVVTLSGTIGRPQPPAPNDVCAFIPAGFIPYVRTGWTTMWSYDNLASQIVNQYITPANGYVNIGFVITVGGAPGGQCRADWGQSWLIG
jgi:hypothetical protein